MQLYLPDRPHPATQMGAQHWLVLGLALLCLHGIAASHYLLFHSLVEMARLIVLAGIFVLAWNSQAWVGNSFLLLIGVSSLFVGILELFHTLAYKGLGAFPQSDANLPTQLWIAFRYLESLSLLAALRLIDKKVSPRLLFIAYASITAGLGLAIYLEAFPDCYLEGSGLSEFKIASEYLIAALFTASLALLYRRRSAFEAGVYRLLSIGIACGACAEIFFTRYVSVYGYANEFGHYLLLISAYLFYRAVLVTGIIAPFDLLFRSMKDQQAALENTVAVRGEELRHLAHHDSLTGLPNRLLFEELFALAAERSQRAGHSLALVSLDLDNFKVINDSLGHLIGDQLIKQIALRLSNCLGEHDALCRSGGDEFFVLLGDCASVENATRTVIRMLQQICEPARIEAHELVTTASVGIALFPQDGENFETLLKCSDMALFQAKEGGRNTYRYFDERMNRDAGERLALLGALRGAVGRGELLLHYQPQIDLRSGALVGAEALIRWQHPQLGLLPPARFIPLAEDCGLIDDLGTWVLEEACHQAGQWLTEGLPELAVAVNLSALQFRNPNLYETVLAALLSSGLPAHQLELELTESILIRDTESVLETVRRFKALGLKLSIDDFGTGYSSLSYLKRFAVDKLKIDQSFVRSMVDHLCNCAY